MSEPIENPEQPEPTMARDLYAIALKPGLHYDRPCGCNQGTGQGESCVLMAIAPDGFITLKDSKNPSRPDLRFEPAEFTEFLRSQRVITFLADAPASA